MAGQSNLRKLPEIDLGRKHENGTAQTIASGLGRQLMRLVDHDLRTPPTAMPTQYADATIDRRREDWQRADTFGSRRSDTGTGRRTGGIRMDVELWGEGRLRLRPWRETDLVPLIDVCRDPALRRRSSLPRADPGDARRWLDEQRRGWDTGRRLSFAVHELPGPADEHRLVGGVVLKRSHPGSASAEVGYWTAGHARGQGIASRAVEAMCVWSRGAHATEGLQRWELLHQIDNLASCRVAEKSRFHFHRILPAAPPFPLDGHLHVRQVIGRHVDSLTMAPGDLLPRSRRGPAGRSGPGC